MRPNTHLALLLTLTLTACGGGDPKEEGFTALNSGDHQEALDKFDAALAGADASSPDYVELSVGRCRALAHVDPARSLSEFTALSAEITEDERLGPGDFREVVTELLSSDNGAEDAVRLMDLGVKRFPESDAMKKTLDTVVAAIKKRGDKGASALLTGMGYGGGGD